MPVIDAMARYPSAEHVQGAACGALMMLACNVDATLLEAAEKAGALNGTASYRLERASCPHAFAKND